MSEIIEVSTEDDFGNQFPEESTIREAHTPFNILSANHIKINEKFLVEVTVEGNKNINKETKEDCKILKFSSEWNFDEILTKIAALKQDEFPNLFVYIVDVKNVKFFEDENSLGKCCFLKKNKKVSKLKKALIKFCKFRPLILQLTSRDEGITKVYYKKENSGNFFDIEELQKNFKEFNDFGTLFMMFLNEKSEIFEERVLNNFKSVQNSSPSLRFLRSLDLSEKFFNEMVLKCASSGSKSDLLAAIDVPFEKDGKILSTKAQLYLTNAIIKPLLFNKPENEQNEDFKEEENDDASSLLSCESSRNLIEQTPERDEEDSSSEESFVSCDDDMDPSLLLTALLNENRAVVDFLINHQTHLIQQLPFREQVRISTIALRRNQLDILCDLLEIADFPFPKKFNSKSFNHTKLSKITTSRMEFQIAIEAENFEEMFQFIDNNMNLKIVYTTANISAMKHAVVSKKYNSYFYLKSYGFQAAEFDELDKILDKEELGKANICASEQRRRNVNEALSDDQIIVNLMCNRSLIHNRKIKKNQEKNYRAKIRRWYEDISKTEYGAKILDIAASCEKLKIIFDFECDTVEQVAFRSNSMGVAFASLIVFVGAKLSNKIREQEIKGVLAHELCHCVMCLVYANSFLPYYKYATEIRDEFDKIVNEIDQWSSVESEDPDDECDGIISTVFKCYLNESFHLELIVRIVHILALFGDNEDKLRYLQEKYKNLFDFWQKYVFPDLQSFNLKHRKNVKNLNKHVGFLSYIMEQSMDIAEPKDVEELSDSNVVIVASNIPKLLFVDIYKQLNEKFGCLLDSKNLFIDVEKLLRIEIWNDFEEICKQASELNIFVDCTNKIPNCLDCIFVNKGLNFVFAVSNEEQYEKMNTVFNDAAIYNSKKIEMNYIWSDLTVESQEVLLRTKIMFQNASQFSLIDILCNNLNQDELPTTYADGIILNKYSDIINSKLLNLLVEETQISINSLENEQVEIYSELLVEYRKFSKIETNSKGESKALTVEELLIDVNNYPRVLILDNTGGANNWMLQNIANILRKQMPSKWVTYVDLKQIKEELGTQQNKLEFSAFITEKILKSKKNFEKKIFSKCYKDGRVLVLFDGLNEFAPKCAEFMFNLVESFEYNGGNQLWIATTDECEVNLQQDFQLNAIYRVENLTENEEADLIATSWLVNKLKKESMTESRENLERNAKSSPDYGIYQALAILMMNKMKEYDSIGMEEVNQIAVDISKDNKFERIKIKDLVEEFYTSELFRLCILPELQQLLLKRQENIRKFNKISMTNLKFADNKIEICRQKDIKALIDNKLVIVSTNISSFLLTDIQKYLQERFIDSADTRNLFINSKKLINKQIREDLYKICAENSNLNVFVDCSTEMPDNLANIQINKKSNFIFIVTNNTQSETLEQIMKKEGRIPAEMKINYNLSDLTVESQKAILKTKIIKFPNYQQFSIYDLLKSASDDNETTTTDLAIDQKKKILKKFFDVSDDQLFSLLIQKSQIEINFQHEASEKLLKFMPKKCMEQRPSDETNDHINKLSKLDKSDEFVKISYIYELMVESHMNNLVQKCFDDYKLKIYHNQDFINMDNVHDIHEICKNEALKLYEEGEKIGNKLHEEKFRVFLEAEMEKICNDKKNKIIKEIEKKIAEQDALKRKIQPSECGQPITVLKFTDSGEVIIDIDEHDNVFGHPEIQDRKVVILSVIGAFREGKSFFLNYCLRFLYANFSSICNPIKETKLIFEKDENWMGEPDEPLKGFSWRSGIDVVTTGIIMWSDVFLHTIDTTGEKIAIFVMDTQGLFDNDSTQTENMKIFALSTLMPSVQVLNIVNQIQEDQLQYLQFATEYAQFTAMDEKKTEEKPFQSLTFLICDWCNPFEFKFGPEDGEKYIKKILTSKPDKNQQLRSVRDTINSSFEKIRCCLLPKPGKTVTRGKGYDGRCSGMDEDFKIELQNCIESLLLPKHLIMKKVNFKFVNVSEMKKYNKVYLKLTQSKDFSINTIHELEIETFMNELVQKCLKDYKLTIYRYEKLLNKDTILDIHGQCKERAMILFETEKKLGNQEHEVKFRNILHQEIEKNYEEFNDEQQQHFLKIENEREKYAAEIEREKTKKIEAMSEKKRVEAALFECKQQKIDSEKAAILKSRLIYCNQNISQYEKTTLKEMLFGLLLNILLGIESFLPAFMVSTFGIDSIISSLGIFTKSESLKKKIMDRLKIIV